MDGFDLNMRRSLKSLGGDRTISSRDGFFSVDEEFVGLVRTEGVETAVPFVQTQGFLIFQEKASAVIVKGTETFQERELGTNEVVLGAALAKNLQVKTGDEITLALANGNKQLRDRPKLISLHVAQIEDFKLHEHSRRFLFLNLNRLQNEMNLRDRVNLIEINFPAEMRDDEMKKRMSALRGVVGHGYRVIPYDSEFAYLLESVEKEKFIIGFNPPNYCCDRRVQRACFCYFLK